MDIKVIAMESEAFEQLVEKVARKIIEETQNQQTYCTNEIWLNQKEAKKLLGIKSVNTLRKLVSEKRIRMSQFGRIQRYSKESILEFLKENTL